ncbi:ABC transporter permease [Halorientalis salina]|uniref:ABC transporter permease n=1 Tax=Halorientalis salina TaxID=2932266 RepID=UPI002022A7DD|nr:ABC transporter permease [Halorientalis salina]
MALSDLLSDPRAAIARRDLASLSREKTIVLALLIQLFVAAFSSFLVVGLTSLYDPSSVSGEVNVGVTGNASDSLIAATEEMDGIDTVQLPNEATAARAFQDGGIRGTRVDTVIVANHGADRRINVTATAPDGSLQTTLIVVQIRETLEQFERQERQDRSAHIDRELVPLPDDVAASPYFGFTYTILIPLLLFLPPFISGSVAVDAITEEIERGTLELLRVAPVTLVDIVDGKSVAMAMLAPLQALLWILLLGANGISVSNVPLLMLTVASMATVVVVIGVVLGLVMGERKSAQLVYSVGVLGLFASAVFLPEHPATTVAKLAVDSPTNTTYALVALYAAVAVGLYALARAYVDRVDVESL